MEEYFLLLEARELAARAAAAIEDTLDALAAACENPALRPYIAGLVRKVILPALFALMVACGAEEEVSHGGA